MSTPTSKSKTKTTPATRAPRESQSLSPADAAVRVMSETAHDIRSPLATVREAVRLVHDGDLGELSLGQKACLAAAMDQVNCVDQMVGEMVQLERLRTGVPRVRRTWVSVSEIKSTISETLRPWAMPRNINVIWDIVHNESTRVFADPSMIRRLVVNLVANAIRETAEGGSVLVRVQSIRGGEALQWSVVDQGRGISEVEMQEIAERQVTMGGGEGLGLSICRQLSALHFSSLRLESRKGTGTAVSFETAAGSPTSVAECWARWRVGQREPLRKPVSRQQEQSSAKISPPRRVRVDTPTAFVELASEGAVPVSQDRVAAGTVMLGAAMPTETIDAFDVLLQGQARMFDFIYRVDSRQWVWVFDADVRQAEGRIDTINEEASKKIKDIRLSWSDPQVIPLDQRRTAGRLGDLLVRQSLSAATVYFDDAEPIERVAGGIEPSTVPADRLDKELHRLSGRLKTQTQRLHAQSRRLRPNF